MVRCGCGCGTDVKRSYAQGHDARHLSQLINRYLSGDASAMKEAKALGWQHKVERSVASRKVKAERRVVKHEKVNERKAKASRNRGRAATPEDGVNRQVGELTGIPVEEVPALEVGQTFEVKVGRWNKEATVQQQRGETAILMYADSRGESHTIERPVAELVTA